MAFKSPLALQFGTLAMSVPRSSISTGSWQISLLIDTTPQITSLCAMMILRELVSTQEQELSNSAYPYKALASSLRTCPSTRHGAHHWLHLHLYNR
jgi:hypothetical protein